MEVSFVPDDFDARNTAVFREYWYKIINAYSISALDIRYALHYRDKIDYDLLKSYCPVLLGEQDFTAFSASTDQSISKKRFVYSASFIKSGDEFVFKIIANAYLHNMIRIIVGTFLKLQKEKFSFEELKKIISSKKRIFAGPTISPKGLVFKKVYYPSDIL